MGGCLGKPVCVFVYVCVRQWRYLGGDLSLGQFENLGVLLCSYSGWPPNVSRRGTFVSDPKCSNLDHLYAASCLTRMMTDTLQNDQWPNGSDPLTVYWPFLGRFQTQNNIAKGSTNETLNKLSVSDQVCFRGCWAYLQISGKCYSRIGMLNYTHNTFFFD